MQVTRLVPMLVMLVPLLSSSAPATSHPAAVDGVLELLQSADIVLLGERHWSRLDADLRNELIAHPDLPSIATTVVVEFGNSLYQETLDRYLLKLEPVPDSQLALVWRNTRTTTGAWDSPLYEEFYRTVRRVNESLPAESRIRVIAAGQPVDWDRVEVWEDLLPFTHRGWWFTRQIERVMTRGKKAVVILGLGHFLRMDDEMEEDYNVIRRLEALHPGRSFNVVVPFAEKNGSAGRVAEALPEVTTPVLLDAAGEPFAAWPSADFFHGAVGEIQEAVDALIYFGPVHDELVGPPEGFYEENRAYAAELERRRGLGRRLPGSYN